MFRKRGMKTEHTMQQTKVLTKVQISFGFQWWKIVRARVLKVPVLEGIYNPIKVMGFLAIFTFQLENTKK